MSGAHITEHRRRFITDAAPLNMRSCAASWTMSGRLDAMTCARMLSDRCRTASGRFSCRRLRAARTSVLPSRSSTTKPLSAPVASMAPSSRASSSACTSRVTSSRSLNWNSLRSPVISAAPPSPAAPPGASDSSRSEKTSSASPRRTRSLCARRARRLRLPFTWISATGSLSSREKSRPSKTICACHGATPGAPRSTSLPPALPRLVIDL